MWDRISAMETLDFDSVDRCFAAMGGGRVCRVYRSRGVGVAQLSLHTRPVWPRFLSLLQPHNLPADATAVLRWSRTLARNDKTGTPALRYPLSTIRSNGTLPMKRLFLASLLLLPVSAQARSDASALTTACIMDLTVKFAKDPQVTINTALADKIGRMCRCAANKTLSVVELSSDNSTAFNSVYDKALVTCITEQ
jgi:hypothetical protein